MTELKGWYRQKSLERCAEVRRIRNEMAFRLLEVHFANERQDGRHTDVDGERCCEAIDHLADLADELAIIRDRMRHDIGNAQSDPGVTAEEDASEPPGEPR